MSKHNQTFERAKQVFSSVNEMKHPLKNLSKNSNKGSNVEPQKQPSRARAYHQPHTFDLHPSIRATEEAHEAMTQHQ